MTEKEQIQWHNRKSLIKEIKALAERIKATDMTVKTAIDEEVIKELDALSVAIWGLHLNP